MRVQIHCGSSCRFNGSVGQQLGSTARFGSAVVRVLLSRSVWFGSYSGQTWFELFSSGSVSGSYGQILGSRFWFGSTRLNRVNSVDTDNPVNPFSKRHESFG
ncbi:hypothetical protein Hanom_Chr13g01206121 [Helianthus anomalus]